MNANPPESIRRMPHRIVNGVRGVFLADTVDPEVRRLLERCVNAADADARAALAEEILAKLRGNQPENSDSIAADFGSVDENSFVDFCDAQD